MLRFEMVYALCGLFHCYIFSSTESRSLSWQVDAMAFKLHCVYGLFFLIVESRLGTVWHRNPNTVFLPSNSHCFSLTLSKILTQRV